MYEFKYSKELVGTELRRIKQELTQGWDENVEVKLVEFTDMPSMAGRIADT